MIFVIDELKKQNSVVDWVDYIEYTIEKKWDVLNTVSKIEDALIDDPDKEHILNRLKLYLIKRNKS